MFKVCQNTLRTKAGVKLYNILLISALLSKNKVVAGENNRVAPTMLYSLTFAFLLPMENKLFLKHVFLSILHELSSFSP